MAELTRLIAAETIRALGSTRIRRIVDLGGGHGSLLAAFLRAYPAARGVLLELPHAIEGARAYMAEQGLSHRCEFVAGDFFDSIPGAGDTYLLKAVLHDWDDERCATILRNCRRAIAPTGRLVLVERIMPARIGAYASHRAIAWADLTMMVGLGGRERTGKEFRRLLAAAGCKLGKVPATSLEFSVLEGIPSRPGIAQ
jgi:SAM-dependent methyltransferase